MSSTSLIQVYMCAALAKSFLNLDVLWHIHLEQKWKAGELDDAEDEIMDEPTNAPQINQARFHSRRFKMRDDQMHRLFLPLTCALKLCDRIRPQRVAHVVADYLATQVPIYATAPLLLKYTQDLESYVARDNRLQIETWVEWAFQTLSLIKESKKLLRQMQDMSKLVKSFKRSSVIPREVLDVITLSFGSILSNPRS
ncbi:hypothetical protein K439DRAFT_219100 [Ramaria rubella]|nr:hypothetical protein K439DRAFT_219100 [Ramaria rubella]